MIELTIGQVHALGAAITVAHQVMPLSEEDQRAADWITEAHRKAFHGNREVLQDTEIACKVDDTTAANLLRFTSRAYRVALSGHPTSAVLDVLGAARSAMETAGKCPVMYCILDRHEGVSHVDVTGASYQACEHGNLTHWEPCSSCGPKKWGNFLAQCSGTT